MFESAKFIISRLARDRTSLVGACLIVALVLIAIFAPLLAPYPDDVTEFHPPERLLGPSMLHFFGTDRMGSDIFSRMLFGARITIAIAVIAIGVSVLIGVPIGLIAGYNKNWISDGAYQEGGLFLLTMHPHFIGHRSRIQVLDELLAHIKSHPDVWIATHADVARYCLNNAKMK